MDWCGGGAPPVRGFVVGHDGVAHRGADGALAVRALAASVDRHETEVADSARCAFCMLLKFFYGRRDPPPPGAEACRAIEADLGAISPGRAAAGDGHGRLAEGERAFCTFVCAIYSHNEPPGSLPDSLSLRR